MEKIPVLWYKNRKWLAPSDALKGPQMPADDERMEAK